MAEGGGAAVPLEEAEGSAEVVAVDDLEASASGFETAA